MTEVSIFDAEKDIIKKSKSIIEDNKSGDNPLFEDYQRLSTHYEKLFHQFERMMKISDRQQQQLINTKDYILNYNEELKQLNATKDKFFSIIAHDLKSPINSFLNISNILVNYIDKFTKVELVDMATDVKKAGDNLFKLLENLLYWARIQMEKIEFLPELSALDAIVYHNISLLQLQADQKEIKITSNISDDIQVYADPNMLNTVLRNLISNAIKFTKKSGAITISHSESEIYNKISIEDDGIGISPEDQEKLFRIDVNNTQLGTNNEKGTGLGLVLCKEMIDKHQGAIEVDSVQDAGTTFTFSLMKKVN
jgi:signal transduction histidine kinase